MPTLARNPTFAELDELIAAKDATIRAIDTEASKILPAWSTRAPDEANAWRNEWLALVGRYNSARALRDPTGGAKSLALPPEVIWGAILKSLRQAWDPAGSLTQAAPETPGDLNDLARRLGAQGGKPDFSAVPQPVATDPEAVLFNAADVFFRSLPPIGGLALLVGLFLLSRRR
jgi:hypothetical protein